jgi:hypothetical protein
MATWLEDDITGEWEWLGPPPAERRSFNAAMASEILKEVYAPVVRDSLFSSSALLGFLDGVLPERGETCRQARHLAASDRARLRELEREHDRLEQQIREHQQMMSSARLIVPTEPLDTERRLSYDFDSHAHHERLQIAMAEWRPRRRREDEGR